MSAVNVTVEETNFSVTKNYIQYLRCVKCKKENSLGLSVSKLRVSYA